MKASVVLGSALLAAVAATTPAVRGNRFRADLSAGALPAKLYAGTFEDPFFGKGDEWIAASKASTAAEIAVRHSTKGPIEAGKAKYPEEFELFNGDSDLSKAARDGMAAYEQFFEDVLKQASVAMQIIDAIWVRQPLAAGAAEPTDQREVVREPAAWRMGKDENNEAAVNGAHAAASKGFAALTALSATLNPHQPIRRNAQFDLVSNGIRQRNFWGGLDFGKHLKKLVERMQLNAKDTAKNTPDAGDVSTVPGRLVTLAIREAAQMQTLAEAYCGIMDGLFCDADEAKAKKSLESLQAWVRFVSARKFKEATKLEGKATADGKDALVFLKAQADSFHTTVTALAKQAETVAAYLALDRAALKPKGATAIITKYVKGEEVKGLPVLKTVYKGMVPPGAKEVDGTPKKRYASAIDFTAPGTVSA